MDRTLALRLIDPIQVGEPIIDGWSLRSIVLRHHPTDLRRDAIELVFSEDFQLVITRRSEAGAAFRSRHFNVGVRSAGATLSESQQAILEQIRLRMEANDLHAPPSWQSLLGADEGRADEARFWLIPGHIGNPLDLSLRSLRVLQKVQLLFIEEGASVNVQRIFEQFSLGPLPPLVEVGADETVLDRPLRSGVDAGLTMALFGAAEGAPGICDPGWRVLTALRRVAPDLQPRSTSGGSALTTAMMYLEQPESAFLFLGLFQPEDGGVSLFRVLRKVGILSQGLPMICFASGEELRREWAGLCHACAGLRGRLSLFIDLTRDGERVEHLALSELAAVDPAFLGPTDKVVMRIQLQTQLNPRQWFRRLRSR